MQLTWNDSYRDLIGGLDILGVRQLDQGLELQLVGGITTVAPRARYLTLVTWALDALYRRLLDEGDGELKWTEDEQDATLTRLEFLVAAATQAGSRQGEAGNLTGIVGSDVYREILGELAAAGHAAFPPGRRPGVVNAYGSPAQAFGLLAATTEGGPLALTPRGQVLLEQVPESQNARQLLFAAGHLTVAQLDQVRPVFSLNGLGSSPHERAALVSALDEPPGTAASTRTDRFRATRAWAIALLQLEPTDGDGLVDRAYADLVSGRATTEIALLWGEVALRKRVHFALELLLAALANRLEADRGSTVPQVVRDLAVDLEDELPPASVERAIGAGPIDFTASWPSWCDRVPDDAFLVVPPHRNLGRLPPAWQMAVALALLAATERQSRAARTNGVVKERDRQAMEQSFGLLAGHQGSIADLATRVLRDEVASRHLRHTMRKMSQRQSNSLRFFPRGESLVPTGTGTGAGFSLTRMSAVLQVMADIGHLRSEGGVFTPTAAGLAWAEKAAR